MHPYSSHKVQLFSKGFIALVYSPIERYTFLLVLKFHCKATFEDLNGMFLSAHVVICAYFSDATSVELCALLLSPSPNLKCFQQPKLIKIDEC